MDAEKPCNNPSMTHGVPHQLLSKRLEEFKHRPQPEYECAGARATRMVIEASSYQTTPSSSPPNEFCDIRHNLSFENIDIADEISQGSIGERNQAKYIKRLSQTDLGNDNRKEAAEGIQPLKLPKGKAQTQEDEISQKPLLGPKTEDIQCSLVRRAV